MKKKKHTPIFFIAKTALVLFFVCSCNYQLLAQTIMTVDPIQREKILFSEIFDSVRYVKLETTEDLLIRGMRGVQAMKYSNNRIYILSRSTETLFSFDANTGKCLWKIQDFDQCPSGYNQPRDFDIDERNNRLYVLISSGKIQEYDLSGNFVKEYNIQVSGSFIASKDDYLYIYASNTSNMINAQRGLYYLLIYNKNTGSLKGTLPFEDNANLGTTRVYGLLARAFYHYNNEVRFFTPYSQNIYSIKGNQEEIAYQFDFGKYNLPNNLSNYSSFEELDKIPYVYGLNSVWENGQYLSMAIQTPFLPPGGIQTLYSKQNKQVRVGGFFDDVGYIFPWIALATDDFVLGYKPTEDIFRAVDAIKAANRLSDSEGALLQKIASEMTEKDNPIILFYYFKNRAHAP